MRRSAYFQRLEDLYSVRDHFMFGQDASQIFVQTSMDAYLKSMGRRLLGEECLSLLAIDVQRA